MHRHPHILNAATNLLGICFIIIGSLKLTNLNGQTWADEIAWAATFLLFISTLLSYLAIRNDGTRNWQVVVADYAFIGGVVALICSVSAAAIQL